MKANAPEKIYLCKVHKSDQFDSRWWSKKASDKDIEYIRADAFIEKAVSYLNSKLYDWVQTTNPNQRSCANTIMKQDFIENFRKYMEV